MSDIGAAEVSFLSRVPRLKIASYLTTPAATAVIKAKGMNPG